MVGNDLARVCCFSALRADCFPAAPFLELDVGSDAFSANCI